jgi:transcriptional antiterminator RfaH
MPTLAAEPDLFPPDLLDRAPDEEYGGRSWWLLYTRSRQGKELMRKLRSLEIPFYGPLVERRSRTPAGRYRTAFIPLFSNYVFMFGNAEQRYDALATNCISRDIPVVDSPDLIWDLQQLRRLIQSGEPLTPEARMAPGVPVRVRSGPLAGQEGIVLQRRGETRLLVAVRFLQQGASVLVDECDLERLD